MIQPDAQGLYHPLNEDDIVELIQNAIQNKLQVRVRGAAQSVTNSVFTDDVNTPDGKPGPNINMELDQLRSITWGPDMQVTVGGGCNLGFDPFDPSDVSAENDSNNLFYQLDQKGLAIPNVPGAIHQTIAGYISTGSSAGTMQHSFDECILAIRIIDGTGKAQTFTKSANLDDPFYGVVVSMGLLGIITSVTLQCVQAFSITGKESISPVADTEFDFFGPGSDTKLSLQSYLTTTEFSRTLWWPFNTLQRVIAWKASTTPLQDGATGTPALTPKPYQPLFPKWFKGLGAVLPGSIASSTLPSEFVAATAFQLIATWPDWLYEILGAGQAELSPADQEIVGTIEKIFPLFYPLLTDLYFPCNTPDDPAQLFWGNWLQNLPMDKVEYSNNLFDLVYTEIWVPAGMASKMVNTLQSFYEKNGYTATGFYTVEILAAKQSNFWLSPGYGGDAVRFNILFFKRSVVQAQTYFGQFWVLLNENNINFRPHWGKNLPPPDGANGPAYLQNQYPKWKDFISLRAQMDPNNIFLNNYWKAQLDIN